MSKSRKKAIYKDKGFKKPMYNRIVRRATKQAIHNEEEIPSPKELVNDYDYCDYRFDHEYTDKDKYWTEKLSRK